MYIEFESLPSNTLLYIISTTIKCFI